MTLFLHTKDFYYPKKMKTCFFARAEGKVCVQSAKQRNEKSPATCLRPSLPRLPSAPRPSLQSQRAWMGTRAPRNPVQCLAVFLSSAQCRPQRFVRCTQSIKYTFQMPYVPRIERFLLVNISLFTKTCWHLAIEMKRMKSHEKYIDYVTSQKMKIHNRIYDKTITM